MMRTEYEASLERLKEASKAARRTVSADVEWTATQFREFMRATRALCDEVDRHITGVETNTLSTAKRPGE